MTGVQTCALPISIVRGGLDLLNDENKKYFIGVSKNSFGFEAIAKNKNEVKRIFKDKCIIERPTLEDIMIHTVRGERNVQSYI